MITIIAAIDKNNIIGKNGKIPWYLPEDQVWFKKTTINQIVVMGRITWESLPKKPLSQRINIVISRTFGVSNYMLSRQGAFFVAGLIDAINISKLIDSTKEIFIIGGAKIYQHALDLGIINRMLITQINQNYDGDTYFPLINEKEWDKQKLHENSQLSIFEFTKTSRLGYNKKKLSF